MITAESLDLALNAADVNSIYVHFRKSRNMLFINSWRNQAICLRTNLTSENEELTKGEGGGLHLQARISFTLFTTYLFMFFLLFGVVVVDIDPGSYGVLTKLLCSRPC